MAAAGSDEQDDCWGNTWLAAIVDALGIGGDVKSVRLHFEYGFFATATITRPLVGDEVVELPIFGTNAVSAALAAPFALQAITVQVEENSFVICECRYVPLKGSMADFVAALRVNALEAA